MEQILMLLCGIIILPYFFIILSRDIRVPSIHLLLAAGIVLRALTTQYNLFITFLPTPNEGLGGEWLASS